MLAWIMPGPVWSNYHRDVVKSLHSNRPGISDLRFCRGNRTTEDSPSEIVDAKTLMFSGLGRGMPDAIGPAVTGVKPKRVGRPAKVPLHARVSYSGQLGRITKAYPAMAHSFQLAGLQSRPASTDNLC